MSRVEAPSLHTARSETCVTKVGGHPSTYGVLRLHSPNRTSSKRTCLRQDHNSPPGQAFMTARHRLTWTFENAIIFRYAAKQAVASFDTTTRELNGMIPSDQGVHRR